MERNMDLLIKLLLGLGVMTLAAGMILDFVLEARRERKRKRELSGDPYRHAGPTTEWPPGYFDRVPGSLPDIERPSQPPLKPVGPLDET